MIWKQKNEGYSYFNHMNFGKTDYRLELTRTMLFLEIKLLFLNYFYFFLHRIHKVY